MNLLQKLREQNESDLVRMQEQLDTARQLLSHDQIRERDILSNLGIDFSLTQYENKNAKYLEKQSLVRKFGTDVFHISQVQEICMDYNLRFLPSNLFKGWVDHQIGPKVRNFVKEKNIADYDLDNSFFVMAPPKQFELREIEKVSPRYDPVLFYQIDEEHFFLVHQWGRDLSDWRFVTSFGKKSFFHSQIHYFLITFAALLLFAGLFKVTSLFVALFLALLGSATFIGIRYSYLRNDNQRDVEENYTKNMWNKDYKVKEV
jgi:hypothetical protein